MRIKDGPMPPQLFRLAVGIHNAGRYIIYYKCIIIHGRIATLAVIACGRQNLNENVFCEIARQSPKSLQNRKTQNFENNHQFLGKVDKQRLKIVNAFIIDAKNRVTKNKEPKIRFFKLCTKFKENNYYNLKINKILTV